MAEKRDANRDASGRFVKGNCANPRGQRGKLPADARQMLKDALPDAISCIIQHAREGDERCAMYICDRVLGKPTQPMDIDARAEIAQTMTLEQMRQAAEQVLRGLPGSGGDV